MEQGATHWGWRRRHAGRAPRVIARATNCGQLTTTDPAPARLDAAKAAVTDARSRAERLADAAWVRLGPVLSIVDEQETGGASRVVLLRATADTADTAARPPMRAGTGTVTARVTVTFQLS